MPKLILTDRNFSEEVLKNEKLVLVDFWASWCVPCQMLAPIIEEIAEELKEKIKAGKLNVDENPLISAVFMIDLLPTIALFKNGKIIKKLSGVQPKEIILEAINSIINDEK
ncbi:MAG: thioredoxin 1 [Parcubacteria group bacterium Athens0714_12]|nr:MAG: thioredoxin 1 [Parcubacteria group bacterium Athens0714_12]